jgi:hypothetical protein
MGNCSNIMAKGGNVDSINVLALCINFLDFIKSFAYTRAIWFRWRGC